MCIHLQLPGGGSAIICGMRERRQFCTCGREATVLCDWKVAGRKSGTCDVPCCAKHALQVAPQKHLCPAHQQSYDEWKRRHPDGQPSADPQLGLFQVEAKR